MKTISFLFVFMFFVVDSVMIKNPKLIKEPIAIRGHQAMFVKTPSDLSRL